MLYQSLKEYSQVIPKHHRLLGIDPGRKKIGLALSDVTLMLASPKETVKRGKMLALVQTIRQLQKEEAIGGLVCGLPLSLSGEFGPAAQAARDWVIALSQATALPAYLWDERLTTSAVNRLLIEEADLSRKRRGEVVDKVAASYMLQTVLDKLKTL
ncbi:Putative pre-16S rRNA nuclease [Commensalibacter sp. Nvir]|uniref:Holliday junction resolvase RuvX n=1 Tax=Commensalibacter sp. Nvir TaxID=3069817 RepID=UPI002D686BD3|nr:Putative pre-16S rRNA nuclease [Commensalibacter sp. Nvir]